MKVTFQFNPKSSGQNVNLAKSLVEECGGIIESDYCQIDFNSFEDINLRRLCRLVGNLKDSKVSINDKEPVNAKIILHIANCVYKHLCKENFENISSEFNPQISDIDNLNYEKLNEEYFDDISEYDRPLGYICKTIRKEDGEVVDVSYKTFDQLLKKWEQADYLRDNHVINVIKPFYDKNEELKYRIIHVFRSKYNIEK